MQNHQTASFKRPTQIKIDEAESILQFHGEHLIPAREVGASQIKRTWEIMQSHHSNSSFIYVGNRCQGILSFHSPQYVYNLGKFENWESSEEGLEDALGLPQRLFEEKVEKPSTSQQESFLLKSEQSQRQAPCLVTTPHLPTPEVMMNWIKKFNLRPISFLEGWEVTLDDYVEWVQQYPLKYEYLALKKIEKPNPSDKTFSELLSLDRTLRGVKRSRTLIDFLNLEGIEGFLVLRERKPIGYAFIDFKTGMIGPANTINDELVDVVALLGTSIIPNLQVEQLSFYIHSLSLIDEKPWLESNFKITKILNTFMNDFIGRFDFYLIPNLILL